MSLSKIFRKAFWLEGTPRWVGWLNAGASVVTLLIAIWIATGGAAQCYRERTIVTQCLDIYDNQSVCAIDPGQINEAINNMSREAGPDCLTRAWKQCTGTSKETSPLGIYTPAT